MHNENVDRTIDGTGRFEEMDPNELQQSDAAPQWSKDHDKTFPYRGQGIQVPTLKELFDNFRETCLEIPTSASRTEVRNFVLLGKVFLSGIVAPRYQSI